MIKEVYYMVTLCRYGIYGEKVTLDDSIDYGKLYVLSNRHNLSAIVFTVINTSENKEVVPPDVLKRFEEDFFEDEEL